MHLYDRACRMPGSIQKDCFIYSPGNIWIVKLKPRVHNQQCEQWDVRTVKMIKILLMASTEKMQHLVLFFG